MADMQWLWKIGCLAVGGFAFLMLLSGARRGIVEQVAAMNRHREEEEPTRKRAEREAAAKNEVVEVQGVE